MRVVPAVDIRSGMLVRMLKGDPKNTIYYNELGSIKEVVGMWVDLGADLIHLIDLDGALGLGNNLNIILEVVREYNVKFQIGGGIRNRDKAEALLNSGIYRVILGSLALEHPKVVEDLILEYGWDRIMVALDYKADNKVVYMGWKVNSNMDLLEAIHLYREIGCRKFLLTSVDRDGMLCGPNIKALRRLSTSLEGVYVAGGIKSVEEILELKKLGIEGVVIGRALYEGYIDFKLALELVRNGSS